MFESIKNIDEKILLYISKFRRPLLDKIMVCITRIGNTGAIWILISFALFISPNNKKRGKSEGISAGSSEPLGLKATRAREIGVLETQTARQGPSITWAQSLDTQKMPLCWGIADSRLSGVSG